mgnify:CR=1 FL=1|tara:strand:- start:70 stop:402 length:333 start_codon:yes stop_codon:yes gene_type:complete
MKTKERHFHEDYYKILEKCTKAELITKLEDSSKRERRTYFKLDMPGEYQIRILKNKKEVQELNFTWKDNPHGAKWDEVKDLEHSLMSAYQDYESLVESEILIKNDWDERR